MTWKITPRQRRQPNQSKTPHYLPFDKGEDRWGLQTSMKTQITKYWKPLLAVVFWGVSFIATKFTLEEMAPRQIIFYRLILASSFLFVFALYTKRDFRITLTNHGYIFILAFIAVLHLWIQITGLKYTTASNTGWIIGTAPVFIALLGFIFYKESLTPIKIVGILIAFFGVLLLISKGDFSTISFISNKGDFLILASAFNWGIYSMVNKKISLNYPPVMTILFLFLMMAIIISPFIISDTTFDSIKNLSVRGWISILFLGILCSGVAYVLWAQSLKEMESSKAGAFLYFEPFVTIAAAGLMLGERITLFMIVSGLIITGGVILVNFDIKKLSGFSQPGADIRKEKL
jgi:drug/metabolite transporter (DMT)-like permease